MYVLFISVHELCCMCSMCSMCMPCTYLPMRITPASSTDETLAM